MLDSIFADTYASQHHRTTITTSRLVHCVCVNTENSGSQNGNSMLSTAKQRKTNQKCNEFFRCGDDDNEALATLDTHRRTYDDSVTFLYLVFNYVNAMCPPCVCTCANGWCCVHGKMWKIHQKYLFSVLWKYSTISRMSYCLEFFSFVFYRRKREKREREKKRNTQSWNWVKSAHRAATISAPIKCNKCPFLIKMYVTTWKDATRDTHCSFRLEWFIIS